MILLELRFTWRLEGEILDIGKGCLEKPTTVTLKRALSGLPSPLSIPAVRFYTPDKGGSVSDTRDSQQVLAMTALQILLSLILMKIIPKGILSKQYTG